MPRHFSDQQLEDLAGYYDEHGAVHLPGFIEPDLVRTVLGEIDKAVAASTGPEAAPGYARSYGRGKGRMTIRSQSDENPVIRGFLLRRELAEPIARITRCRVLQFWFDLTFIHEASAEGEAGEGSGWHHDIAAFGFKGEKLPSLWMAMTPAVAGQSRIEFIDRSHRNVPGYFRPPTSTPDPMDGMLEIPDYDAMVRDGQGEGPGLGLRARRRADHPSVHDPRIQGQRGQCAAGRRVAITTRWLGDDVRWLPLERRTAYGAGIDPAHPPVTGSRPSRTAFPLVWST